MLKSTLEMLQKHFPNDEVQLKKIGKIDVLEFDVFFNLKVVVTIDYITNHYSYICYDVCNGGHYKTPYVEEWGVVRSMGDNSLDSMLKSLDNYLSILI